MPPRKLEVQDEAAGARMRAFFDAAGWVTDRNAVMLREGPAPAHAYVEEVELLETRPLRVEWYLSYENDEAAQEAVPRPRTASRCAAGCARSSCATRRLPGRLHDARGRRRRRRDRSALRDARGARDGIGGRLVETALAAGGRETAWVIADDDGLARALYERLGSRPSGSSTRSSNSRTLGEPPAAGEVRRGAHVAPEGGVGDDPRVPGERLLGRGLDREVGAQPVPSS